MDWDEFINTPIDYNSLPEDCYASAAERIRVALRKRECPNPKDIYRVLGDPCEGISLPISPEEAREHFLRKREDLVLTK